MSTANHMPSAQHQSDQPQSQTNHLYLSEQMPSTEVSDLFLASFLSLLFDPNTTSEGDKVRWFTQPIQTKYVSLPDKSPNFVTEKHFYWGLVQTHGGPCGVITAIQAEMIRSLKIYEDIEKHVSPREAEKALCDALGMILARCAIVPPVDSDKTSAKRDSSSCVNVVLTDSGQGLSIADFQQSRERFRVVTIGSKSRTKNPATVEDEIRHLSEATSDFLFESGYVKMFGYPCGVILFLLSIVKTRGVETIQSDMDDPANAHLTAQFGHSSQELINLLLTGQASSNTFDNTVILGDGTLKCHGIQSQPDIGYLSQLEALRYCCVGSYYKSPKYPIWIVGSSSHFTVLFGPTDSLKECKSDILLDRCRRAFKSVTDAEENGFIPVSMLDSVMKELKLDVGGSINTLAAALEMSGAGIILWSDFWKVTSRLMTGASIESVLNTKGGETAMSSNSSTTPLMITQYGESDKHMMESDEAMARRLAAEWGTDQTEKSDEEIARELQAQLESDHSTGGSSNEVQIIENPQPNSSGNNENPIKESQQQSCHGVKQMETFHSSSFPLHHYNCLRGGELSTFYVTRLNSEEAVGMPVPLTPATFDVRNSNRCREDLELVVRTKYISCKFDWGDRQPPSLH